MANGYILYEGQSMIDGQDIVVIATGFDKDSKNSKTGDMIQTWILCKDIDPREANKLGLDYSICGDCKLRGTAVDASSDRKLAEDRACYVAIYQAPLNVWKTYKKGGYDYVQGHNDLAELGRDNIIRLGSYGDPSAVPSYLWDSLLSYSKGRTGYTHQKVNQRYDLCMKSADTLEEAETAWSSGIRTFRVIKSVDSIVKGKEVLCPASEEAGRRTTCDSCKLCSGSVINAKSIAIVGHGAGAKYI
jgi:hypothetical protein